jgi:hypothetical protein
MHFLPSHCRLVETSEGLQYSTVKEVAHEVAHKKKEYNTTGMAL